MVDVHFNADDHHQLMSCGRDKLIASSPPRCPLLQLYMGALLDDAECMEEAHLATQVLAWQAQHGLLQVRLGSWARQKQPRVSRQACRQLMLATLPAAG